MDWKTLLIQIGEALAVAVATYFGAVPGVPANDPHSAIALGLVKAVPTSTLMSIMGKLGQGNVAAGK